MPWQPMPQAGTRAAPARIGFDAPIATMVIVVALFLTFPAHAQTTWSEIGDAGETIATAQLTVGPGPLLAITGTLATDADVDIYCFRVQDQPLFSLSLTNCLADTDPDLFLFNPGGFGLSHNDACALSSVTISNTFVPGPGFYYVAIAGNDALAFAGASEIWLQASTGGERAPDGPGAGLPYTSMGGPRVVVNNATYLITVSGSVFHDAAVSANPSSWARLKTIYR